MSALLFILFASAVLACLWWFLVISPFRRAFTHREAERALAPAVCLAAITLLWVLSILRLAYQHIFS